MSKKINELVHSANTVSEILKDIKNHLGIILVAEAGHGKSYTAFSLVKEAMKEQNMTIIVLSPSTIWRRKFGAINFVKVGTVEFNPIREIKKTQIEDIPFIRDSVFINLDKKWTYQRSEFLEDLLRNKQHLLFEIKYRNGRRIKAFESLIISIICELQERELEKNPLYNHHYLICLEEIQNSFGTFSMNSDDSLELMTYFTESRSDFLVHYIGIGQRLNDISTKVIERLRPLIGLTLGENSLRKIRSQLPDNLKQRVQELPLRHWIYLDGSNNPEIEIPEYHKEGSPNQLKPKIEQPQPKEDLSKKFQFWQIPRLKKNSTLKTLAGFLNFLFGIPKANENRKPQKKDTDEEEEDGSVLISENSEQQSEEIFW